jgi:hypothetical protein
VRAERWRGRKLDLGASPRRRSSGPFVFWVRFYGSLPPGIKQWGLEQACAYVRQAGFRTANLNEAVSAFTHTRDFYGEFCEQMPNATLELDRDGNGRPDGWFGCVFAPEEAQHAGKRAMTIVGSAARTTLYGPEPGRSRLCLLARRAGDKTAHQISRLLDTGSTLIP